jgi:hypothetical protein
MKGNNMNAKSTRVPTTFAPETRFEVRPAIPAAFRASEESAFERLKNRLLNQRLNEPVEPGVNSDVRRAANDAAALAWVTPYPLLVFPALFEEKAEAALTQAQRQGEIRERSRELLAV